MAKITLNLDERCMQNGKAQVRIRISHKCTNCFISTGVYVEPQFFQPDTLHDAVHRKAPMAAQLRSQISAQVQQIEGYLADVNCDELATMTANDIRERARACMRINYNSNVRDVFVNNDRCKPLSSQDFVHWFGQYGDSRLTSKTRESYTYCWNVLREYCKSLGLWTLAFHQIDYSRLADFSSWLTSTGRGPSTRHMLESYVRAAYKEAQRRHLVSRENDPYYDYSIKPVPRKEIDTLTAEEMHTLMTAKLPTKGMQQARDIAMMLFYLCGANLLDIYEMNAAKHNEVVFVRHKVETRDQMPLHIRIEPELKTLVDLYKGDDKLLYFKSTYSNYESFRHKIYHRLQDISQIVGFNVTMGKIRRTWATLAAELDVSDLVINKSMGHIVNTINANHYVKYKWIKTAEANRRVIDYVLKSNRDDCRSDV